jgi:hypothetical protein
MKTLGKLVLLAALLGGCATTLSVGPAPGSTPAAPEHGKVGGFPSFPATGGGGGVTSVAGLTGVVTTGGLQTALSIQASSAVAITGGTITGTTIAFAPAQLAGDGPVSVTASTGVVNRPTLTGLTATATTLKNDVITGKTGGQTIYGDTATSGNATYRANFASANGKHIWSTTATMQLTEIGVANGPQLSIGTATPQANQGIQVARSLNGPVTIGVSDASNGTAAEAGFWAGQADDFSGSRMQLFVLGTGFTTAGARTAGSVELGVIGGAGNMVMRVFSTGDFVITTTASDTERLRITNAGAMNLGAAMLAANASVATILGSVGPSGSHTTVQEWMAVGGTGGATRWVPLF